MLYQSSKREYTGTLVVMSQGQGSDHPCTSDTMGGPDVKKRKLEMKMSDSGSAQAGKVAWRIRFHSMYRITRPFLISHRANAMHVEAETVGVATGMQEEG